MILEYVKNVLIFLEVLDYFKSWIEKMNCKLQEVSKASNFPCFIKFVTCWIYYYLEWGLRGKNIFQLDDFCNVLKETFVACKKQLVCFNFIMFSLIWDASNKFQTISHVFKSFKCLLFYILLHVLEGSNSLKHWFPSTIHM